MAYFAPGAREDALMSNKHLKNRGGARARKASSQKAAGREAPVSFRREETAEARLSRRDRRRAVAALVLALALLAACAGIWLYRDSFSADGLVLSPERSESPEEYVFESGAGQVFAPVGSGLAAATTSGLELIAENGRLAASRLISMDAPAIAASRDRAVFYDLGGETVAAAFFDGTVEELEVTGSVLSASATENGYLCVAMECPGYRALVRVYDPSLSPVYEWYSASAYVLSAAVSPDGERLAVLSYTTDRSEVRLFSLDREEQLAAFAVSDTVLLDVQWLSGSQLCAYSSGEAYFFDENGQWLDTYGFGERYLTGCAFGGAGCVTFSLSPYRAGTTAELVSLDSDGTLLGTAEVQSEILSLTARDTEILVLCPDSAVLYSSSLTEKGRLTGLAGFKYGLLQSRGKALLISSNYAELHTF